MIISTMKKYISVILALLLAFAAVSCSGNDDIPADTTETVAQTLPETTPAPTTVSLLDENGKALYRIVRPDEGSDGEIQNGVDLKKSLKALTGVDFSITTDFLMPNESLEAVADVPEILLGATNRPESAEARE